ncbi:Alpha/Beta hydrolase protein [Phaeosphaeriaceae sp. PMI808]|nr:Alpha/Beta hydrolase protein [Phaeosphaeriaceae sp. PMI808]
MKFSTLSILGLQATLGAAQNSACQGACQTAFRAAFTTEFNAWVSPNVENVTFYSTPANATNAKPGDLLRWEDLPRDLINTRYGIPAGMSLSRYLYMTEDIDRKPIPASGFVLLPYQKPDPNKPLNTVVWTHGTAGRIRNCAPSNHRDLYYEWQGPYILAQTGYAVIAPDYAGQGSDIPQGFMYEAGWLHAADAAYGLIAARKVLGNLLSQEYVVVGHSEGGMTAWRTNERLAAKDQDELLKAGNFLGSVANSPALRPLDLIPESIRRANGGPIGDAVIMIFLQSLANLFPKEFKLNDWVTDLVLSRVPLAETACAMVGRALFANLTAAELFKSTDWLKLPVVVDWQKRYNGAGPHPLAAPMLVVQGITDPLTYANNTEWDFNQTCNSYPDSQATLLLYPDASHDVASTVTQIDYLAWIKDRFEGKKVPGGCHIKTVDTITTKFRTNATFYVGNAG